MTSRGGSVLVGPGGGRVRSGGFTLVELMVVVVLTAVLAAAAYGAAALALDSEARLRERRATIEAGAIVRALLVDALRHPPEGGGPAMNEMLFELDDGIGGDGLPMDAVRFLSRGVTPPLGTSAAWSVSLAATPGGVLLRAAAPGAAPIEALVEDARGLQARVLYRADDPEWSDRWDVAGRVPAAVSLQLLSASGAPAAPALVVHAGLPGAR